VFFSTSIYLGEFCAVVHLVAHSSVTNGLF